MRAWKRGDIAAGRDRRAATPAAAKHFVAALRGLFHWLVESGLVASDPTEGITVARPKTDGFAELASMVVVAALPPMLTLRVSALEVALFTVTLMP